MKFRISKSFSLLNDFRERVRPRILDRYIFLEIMVPFLVCLLILTTLFMSIVLKDIAGELFGKGIALSKILLYLFYLVSEKLTAAIPIACLFGGILAAGRLSGDSEIVAMRSAGVSFPRIYIVFLFSGFLTTVVVAFMNLYYGPVSQRAREDFENWLKSYHSLSLVKTGRFLGAANMNGLSLTGQDIYAGTRENDILKEVHIRWWLNSVDNKTSERVQVRNMLIPIGDGFLTQIVHAQSGQLIERERQPKPVETEPDAEPVATTLPPGVSPAKKDAATDVEESKTEAVLRLNDGFIIEIAPDLSRVQVTDFTKGSMDYVIPPPPKPLGQLNVKPDNYTFPELFDFLKKIQEGGTEIDPMAILGGETGKVGENHGGVTIKLPGLEQMKAMLQQQMLWIATKAGSIGQPGGPTSEEFQNVVTLSMQMRFFLTNADTTQRKFRLEVQTRIAKSIACMIFFFISFPLGLVVKRSGRGMSFGLALVVFIGYFGLVLLGTNLAETGKVHPAVGGWLPDIVVAIAGVFIMASRTEGFKQRLKEASRAMKTPFVERQLARLRTLARVVAPLFRPLGWLMGVIFTLAGKLVSWFRARILRAFGGST